MVQSVSTSPSVVTQISFILTQNCIAYVYEVLLKLLQSLLTKWALHYY